MFNRMKKVIFIFLASFSISQFCCSQDIITLNTGETILSRIVEIGQTEIKYKKFDNQNGPVYVSAKSDISEIKYENGTKDVFKNGQKNSETVKVEPVAEKISESRAVTATSPAPVTKSKFMMGFNAVLPTSTWPATALSNMGSTSFLKGQDHTVKSYGFGILMQMNISKNISLFLDGNIYSYNILIGKKGKDVQTAWTVAESAMHWDESGAPHIQYVHDLPTDVHFDMQATGFRLGGKYFVGNKKIRPWMGAAFGFYRWDVNYCNEDKSQTYGKDGGYVTGMTFLGGIDFEIMPGIVITPFIDLASPVATYKIEGLFYPQWDIEFDSHIMGTNRFGLTLSFDAGTKSKKKN
jgi:hypothetical protein